MTTLLIDEQLARLVLNYRQAIDDAAADEYRAALEHLPPAIVRAAVTHAIRTRTFLPNVAELLADVDATKGPTRAPFKPCGLCVDGWIEVQREVNATFHQRSTAPAMTRCRCWRDYYGSPPPASLPTKMIDRHPRIEIFDEEYEDETETTREVPTHVDDARSIAARFRGKSPRDLRHELRQVSGGRR